MKYFNLLQKIRIPHESCWQVGSQCLYILLRRYQQIYCKWNDRITTLLYGFQESAMCCHILFWGILVVLSDFYTKIKISLVFHRFRLFSTDIFCRQSLVHCRTVQLWKYMFGLSTEVLFTLQSVSMYTSESGCHVNSFG